MSAGADLPQPATRRLDQWLWFARFAKTRSLAARRCAAGAIAINGIAVKKPNHLVRIGDVILLTQGPWRLRVRVAALGQRRGPAAEARGLYEEVEPPVRHRAPDQEWVPLLADE